jgi:hypothetical protein
MLSWSVLTWLCAVMVWAVMVWAVMLCSSAHGTVELGRVGRTT